jgi:23S rRNA pseudouridine955/2504/2580 synthase
MTSPTTLTVAEDGADSRLDRYLRRNIDGITQAVIQKLCRTGKIRIDGKKAEASTHLPLGATITLPPIADPVVLPKTRQLVVMDANMIRDLEAMILYRDDSVILLNKPAGLPTQGGKGIAVHLDGMLDALRFDGTERPKLVHRLDRDTSGVLLLARGVKAASKLSVAFRGRDLEKVYWALLSGVPQQLAGRIDLPLVRVEMPGTSRSEPANRKDPNADKAVTEYKILDYAGKKFALAELKPQTGRMHQLRVHMLALGTPIVGDAAYGAAFPEGFAPQLHLHARRLTLPHPEGGFLTVEAELPKHMRESFAHLGFTIPETARPKRSR